MRVTLDVSEPDLQDLLHFTGAATVQDAIVTAVTEFNRRCRVATLLRHAGKGESIATVDQLLKQRRHE